MQASIKWPEKYLPGKTDNFVSNEVIVSGITAGQVWPLVADITKWESYYDNVSDIKPPSSGPVLQEGDRFSFSTFGFPPLQVEVMESKRPSKDSPGRLAWRAWMETDDKDKAFDCYHAWILEDLDYGAVRILTQETQNGKPAAEIAKTKPNKMLNGHQAWLDGLVQATKDSLSQGAK